MFVGRNREIIAFYGLSNYFGLSEDGEGGYVYVLELNKRRALPSEPVFAQRDDADFIANVVYSRETGEITSEGDAKELLGYVDSVSSAFGMPLKRRRVFKMILEDFEK